jgi:hypothetical protein
MPKIAKKQLKSKQVFARLIAGSTSQTTEGVSTVRSDVSTSVRSAAETSEAIEAAGTARRSPGSVERIAHPPEGFKISVNITYILNFYE